MRQRFFPPARRVLWLESLVGIDPDPRAVASCLSRGLNVLRGAIDQLDGEESLFDVITLNHVIEHLHDPVAVLNACNRLLKPKGQIWLETPNIDSLGHDQYVKNWRGLEPPRHLVLFNRQSLAKALIASGFTRIENKSRPSPLLSMTKASVALELGLTVEGDIQLSGVQMWRTRKNRLQQMMFPSCKEFLTVAAFKGSAPPRGSSPTSQRGG